MARLRARVRVGLAPPDRRLLAGAAVGAVVVAIAQLSGWVAGADAGLISMGFDPDRAQLISALVIGATAALAVGLVSDALSLAVAVGSLSAAVLYGDTFRSETVAALAATGVNGSFDLGGWLLTLIALATSASVVAWLAATIARPIRRRLLDVLEETLAMLAARRVSRGRLTRPLGVLTIVVLLAVSLPILVELLNYAPDSLMLHGGPPAVGLVPQATLTPSPKPSISPSEAASPTPSAQPTTSPAVPTPTARPHAGLGSGAVTAAGQRPWLAWRPSGSGRLVATALPAPWVGGGTIPLTVYVPPGYDTSGARRYPTVYEAPTPYAFWDSATNVKVALDAMIDGGTMPASIVVFMGSDGSLYPDSECANSFDGRMWMDTYFGSTVPAYVDAHFRTIATPAARSILGMSQGGYCAAILALHHPGMFGAEVSFSGYYEAGSAGASSALPFGGNQALLAADSPSSLAPRLPAAQRGSLYFVLVAEVGQSFYGPQAISFSSILAQSSYPHILVAAAIPHGWTQVRAEFPFAMELFAEREVVRGVFD